MTQDYQNYYNTYPVFAADDTVEPSFKRLSPLPQPQDAYNFALLGLPKVFPLTKEPIMVDMITPFLENAYTEIEMDLGMNISPVEHFESKDYIDGDFEANFSGYKLDRWPATSVIYMQLKFPHTTTTTPYQTYTIPPQWVSLRRNRVNVVAAYGAVAITTDQSAVATAGGIFSYITGFARGAYQPAIIEIRYKAGFPNDMIPNTLAELIKTVAAIRFLENMIPVMFPFSSTNVSIDGVAQGMANNVPQMLMQRLESLRQARVQLSNAITKVFGRTIKMAFI